MKTNENYKDENAVLYGHLKVLCECYSTGVFEPLFPLLADDIVFESQWVLTPNVGREAVEDYFIGKGNTLRKKDCCPKCEIVQLVGNINPIHNADVHINGEKAKRSTFGLLYQDGKLCALMTQELQNDTVRVIIDIKINEENKISRIDLCMPELFNYVPYFKEEEMY